MLLVSHSIVVPMQDGVMCVLCVLLADLRRLAAKYQEIGLSKFLDGSQELLILGLGDVNATIPPHPVS